ncbi:hypothetical protein HII31_12344 [Pseudocercospora fuligena]|uniref:2EXR domain-containing protein n=1 Tax=Pseudocercospora fuligena TaxID=685502 RepID=A0A8H6VFI9_9PEZI|nr:hypothetical protein HII31_12344 [Pseudocercospora fuligena]
MNEQSLQKWHAAVAKKTTKNSANPAPTTSVSVVQLQPSRLPHLPAELWLMIFEYAVTYPKVIDINVSGDDRRSRSEIGVESDKACRYNCCMYKSDQPAITRVNRELRKELLPLFYSLNTFHAYNFPHEGMEKHRWLKAIGIQNTVSLDSLYITTASPNWAQYLKQEQYAHKRMKRLRGFWIKDGEQVPDGQGPMQRHRRPMKVQIAPQRPPKEKSRRAPRSMTTKKKTTK